MNPQLAIVWSDISVAEVAVAIVWAWCVLAVLACVMAGRFKDHPANKDDDGNA